MKAQTLNVPRLMKVSKDVTLLKIENSYAIDNANGRNAGVLA